MAPSVARHCSSLSQLLCVNSKRFDILWRSQTSRGRSSSASAPRLPDGDQSSALYKRCRPAAGSPGSLEEASTHARVPGHLFVPLPGSTLPASVRVSQLALSKGRRVPFGPGQCSTGDPMPVCSHVDVSGIALRRAQAFKSFGSFLQLGVEATDAEPGPMLL